MDEIIGLSLQYRIKPNKEWITIAISDVIITPNPGTTINISGLKSGTIFETRVAQKTSHGMSEYSEISETTIK